MKISHDKMKNIYRQVDEVQHVVKIFVLSDCILA